MIDLVLTVNVINSSNIKTVNKFLQYELLTGYIKKK